MSDCQYHQLLDAYHDGELPEDARREVDRHVASCCLCADHLAGLRRLSGWVRTAGDREQSADGGIRPDELRRMHGAIRAVAAEAREEKPLLRICGAWSAVAASVLIISAAWLTELPRPSPGASPPIARVNTPSPEWERVAMMRYAPTPLPGTSQVNPVEERYAAVVDYMAAGLRQP